MEFQKLADRFIEEGAWGGATITALRLFARWLEEGDFTDELPFTDPTPATSKDDTAAYHGQDRAV